MIYYINLYRFILFNFLCNFYLFFSIFLCRVEEIDALQSDNKAALSRENRKERERAFPIVLHHDANGFGVNTVSAIAIKREITEKRT